MAAAPDTRARVLDAALDLVAERGLQALTHRGVEDRAGVTHGTTTYYFRTRDALIEALFAHLCDRQVVWVTDLFTRLAAAAASGTAGALRDTFSRQALDSLLAERTLTLARFEMYLHAARTPHLQPALGAARQRHADLQAELFAGLGAPDPQLAAHRYLSAVEGMLVYQLSVPEDAFDAWAVAWINALIDLCARFAPQEASGTCA